MLYALHMTDNVQALGHDDLSPLLKVPEARSIVGKGCCVRSEALCWFTTLLDVSLLVLSVGHVLVDTAEDRSTGRERHADR